MRAFTQAGLLSAPGQHTWELSVIFPSPRNQTCAHLQFLYQETQFLITGKHLHRKEGKHPGMLGRLHHTQWGDACRANPTGQLSHHTHSLLNTWGQQHLLKKERKVRKGLLNAAQRRATTVQNRLSDQTSLDTKHEQWKHCLLTQDLALC